MGTLVVIMWEYDSASRDPRYRHSQGEVYITAQAFSLNQSVLEFPSKREISERKRSRETAALRPTGSHVSFNRNVNKYVSQISVN